MVCTRKTKTLVSTCVILSGMTNIICLLYVGWVTNYIATVYVKVQEPISEKKLEEDKGDTLRIIERLDHLENVIKQHIQEAPLKPEENPAEAFTDSSLFAHWGQDLSPENRRIALKQFQYYGYNAYLSDRLPLDRPLPDFRPNGCKNLTFPDSLPEVSIVFIFVNEALSVILRSIHSAIDRTPAHLLKEIILVDDNSNNEELKEKLTEYVDEVNTRKSGFIKVVRHNKQEGLIRSRVSGWRAATAPVVALFDAHVEFNVGWAEPVLTRIKENRKRVISPSFDNIKYDNFEIEEYPLSAQGFDWELWCRYLNPPKSWWKLENTTAPIRSPALIGCFIVDREYFQEIGLLDEGMEVYGGENVELGIRVWQCGGSVEVLPCSRIAHIERAHKPYTEDLTTHVRRNALRVAEVWMDEFKSHVYMAWNIPQEDSGIDIGDISERKALRKKLQCKTFRWYLVSVYPEMRMYSDTVAYGVLQNSLKSDLCLDQGPDTENIPIMYICHGMTPQNVYYTGNQQFHVGVLSPTIDDDDNRCLVDVNSRPRLIECSYAKAKRMKLYWQFTQGGPIQNRKSKRCLELQENSDNEFGFQLVLQKCSGQRWSITNILKSLPL
ncbi:polypeptide N-acetylgalactosaminyltransferase 18 [Lacerta agilis]|uniref:LOW QUALITY PROTEIN: polypeptide N-acetylgalactosaminyltransferase 18 n=1 Tax=Podarcis muralis TaxID=64176 RepID=UPI0010A0641F|nr:LOW QUALITY PROTEIN: polypeptide N-acetylgalactosaminyltransferase 18 [Podarcis muralis]XP_033008387.1 polypeptide N-acetylgalactosaminyltransferase 18 [Lacerta agilis]XP_053247105.1 polypeptide N-acetylgalactosaminyltransferase 18 isoform X2 [Podarcis raffonei]